MLIPLPLTTITAHHTTHYIAYACEAHHMCVCSSGMRVMPLYHLFNCSDNICFVNIIFFLYGESNTDIAHGGQVILTI